jgi:hypothetical protein
MLSWCFLKFTGRGFSWYSLHPLLSRSTTLLDLMPRSPRALVASTMLRISWRTSAGSEGRCGSSGGAIRYWNTGAAYENSSRDETTDL